MMRSMKLLAIICGIQHLFGIAIETAATPVMLAIQNATSATGESIAKIKTVSASITADNRRGSCKGCAELDGNVVDGNVDADVRIVGGVSSAIVNYPYQVSLQYQKVHICGGSIIRSHIVLTAGHCILQPMNMAALRVRVGASSHRSGGQLIGIRCIVRHEKYSPGDMDYDAALLLLERDLTYTPKIQPIQLAASGESLTMANELYVSGWGATDANGLELPEMLHAVQVHLINQSNCAASYQYIATITENMFCAGYPANGGQDSCQGDSGGPLVSVTLSPPPPPPSTVSRKQYGIVSWGLGCGQKDYPGVYSNVAVLRSWIDAKINHIHSWNCSTDIDDDGDG